MMPYVKLYKDMNITIDLLSDEEAGRLLKAVMHYTNGTEDTLPGPEKLIFAMMKAQIERDEISYEQYIQKQRENGSKGGRPKNPDKPTESDGNPTVSEETHGNPENPYNNNNKDYNKDYNKDNNKDDNKKRVRERFEQFWSVYPRKQAKAKAQTDFIRINPDEELTETIIEAVKLQSQSDQWKRDNGQYIPLPSTWLHQRRWEDEVQQTSTNRPQDGVRQVHAQQYKQRDYTEEELAKASGGDNYILQLLEGKAKC